MDPSSFKHHKVSRGLTYNYYYAAAQPPKPTLVFLHGFPSSSYDWRHQVSFFGAQGFGLLVPDLLGYDGTDKPTDPNAYVGSGHAQDIIDLLDAEDVQKAIFVSHDWGSFVSSRIANYHPERAIAFAFVAVGYLPPFTGLMHGVETEKQIFGHEIFGYWEFFSEPGADKLIEKNFDSFFNVFFPNDPSIWKEHLAPSGQVKKWIESDRQTPLPTFITEEEKQHYKDRLLKNGFAAPLNWYKVQTTGISAADEKNVLLDKYAFLQPVFFAACRNDQICIPEAYHGLHKKYAKGPVTIKEFDADHWILISHSNEFNTALLQWIDGLGL